MKNIAIITARMSSSRLPGKVMMRINKIPTIKILYDRLKYSKLLNDIVIATSNCKTDDVLANFLKKKKIKFFRGSKNNVVDRVIKTANHFKAKNIILITGDCPLIDFNLVDQCIRTFELNSVDFVTNANIRSYPDGMDAQIFKKSTLIKFYKKSANYKELEHVTLCMRKNINKKKMINIFSPHDLNYPHIGLTLDDKRDFLLIKKIIKYFWKQKKKNFTCKEVLNYLFSNKKLLNINSNVVRKGDN